MEFNSAFKGLIPDTIQGTTGGSGLILTVKINDDRSEKNLGQNLFVYPVFYSFSPLRVAILEDTGLLGVGHAICNLSHTNHILTCPRCNLL
jgi:hypothetical protein